jgi:hypothetical protein
VVEPGAGRIVKLAKLASLTYMRSLLHVKAALSTISAAHWAIPRDRSFAGCIREDIHILA